MAKPIALAVAVLLGACTLPGRAPAGPAPSGTATVVHPVDGDTIVVDIGGAHERTVW